MRRAATFCPNVSSRACPMMGWPCAASACAPTHSTLVTINGSILTVSASTIAINVSSVTTNDRTASADGGGPWTPACRGRCGRTRGSTAAASALGSPAGPGSSVSGLTGSGAEVRASPPRAAPGQCPTLNGKV
eukprot:971032-Rhodomonas_salina.1